LFQTCSTRSRRRGLAPPTALLTAGPLPAPTPRRGTNRHIIFTAYTRARGSVSEMEQSPPPHVPLTPSWSHHHVSRRRSPSMSRSRHTFPDAHHRSRARFGQDATAFRHVEALGSYVEAAT